VVLNTQKSLDKLSTSLGGSVESNDRQALQLALGSHALQGEEMGTFGETYEKPKKKRLPKEPTIKDEIAKTRKMILGLKTEVEGWPGRLRACEVSETMIQECVTPVHPYVKKFSDLVGSFDHFLEMYKA
jgi:hypothetical protein